MSEDEKIADVTEMYVRTVGLDPTGQSLVILADKEERRLLPIWIGPFEAHAIASRLREEPQERPFTHDLLYDVISQLGHKVDRVVVNDLRDGTYYALVILHEDGAVAQLDARPSDAIALAVRAQARIYVADAVLDKAAVLSDEAEEEDVEKFKQLMDRLDLSGGKQAPEPPESEVS
ncbi:MAG: bifunctional nuclease family protein [Armatimonadota bacterium]